MSPIDDDDDEDYFKPLTNQNLGQSNVKNNHKSNYNSETLRSSPDLRQSDILMDDEFNKEKRASSLMLPSPLKNTDVLNLSDEDDFDFSVKKFLGVGIENPLSTYQNVQVPSSKRGRGRPRKNAKLETVTSRPVVNEMAKWMQLDSKAVSSSNPIIRAEPNKRKMQITDEDIVIGRVEPKRKKIINSLVCHLNRLSRKECSNINIYFY